jgi:hypothetical protein
MSTCPHGNNYDVRQGVLPTGPCKKIGSILVDATYGCDCYRPVYPERLNYHEARWIERWNKRAAGYKNPEPGRGNCGACKFWPQPSECWASQTGAMYGCSAWEERGGCENDERTRKRNS